MLISNPPNTVIYSMSVLRIQMLHCKRQLAAIVFTSWHIPSHSSTVLLMAVITPLKFHRGLEEILMS